MGDLAACRRYSGPSTATSRAETLGKMTPVASHAPLPGATGPQGSSVPGDRLWCVLCVL